jgi:hypothetical protein
VTLTESSTGGRRNNELSEDRHYEFLCLAIFEGRAGPVSAASENYYSGIEFRLSPQVSALFRNYYIAS